MADGAGDSVGGCAVFAERAERGRCEKTCALRPSDLAVKCVRGMWQVEHSFSMAAWEPGWSIVSRRTLPCQ